MDKRTANRIYEKLNRRNPLDDPQNLDLARRAKVFYDPPEEAPPEYREAYITRKVWQEAMDPESTPDSFQIEFPSAGPYTFTGYLETLYAIAAKSLNTGLRPADAATIYDAANELHMMYTEMRLTKMGGLAFTRELRREMLRKIERLSDMDGGDEAWFITGYIAMLAQTEMGYWFRIKQDVEELGRYDL